MQMMPPHMMPPGQGPPKPLFPSAVPTSSASSPGAPIVGADFKPITSGAPGAGKPTFPAYSSATISAPPTTNTAASSNDSGKVAMIATTGAASKIIHPAEDVSLEELRARLPRYHRTIPQKREEEDNSASNSAAEVSFTFLLFCFLQKNLFLKYFLSFYEHFNSCVTDIDITLGK